MKKALLLLTLTLVLTTANAQFRTAKDRIARIERMSAKSGNYTHKLAHLEAQYDFDYMRFTYDADHRLTTVHQKAQGDDAITDSLFYNAQGQLVRIDEWQYYQGREWIKANYVEYTYDQNGNIATRKNYNRVAGYELGGTYKYTYNERNQILHTELEMGGIIYQTIDYTYNQDNLMATETWGNYNGYTIATSAKRTYFYTDGRLTLVSDSAMSDNGYSWEYDGKEEYQYDAAGNCTQFSSFDRTAETERRVYEFSDLTLDQTLFPDHPELERPYRYDNANAYIVEHWWAADVDHRLQYVLDYNYTYTDINLGIANTESSLNVSVCPNPASDYITIQGLDNAPASIQIFDAASRMIANQQVCGANASVSIQGFAAGNYIVRITQQGRTSTQKLIVK